MKLKLIIIPILLLSSMQLEAEKLNLTCDAAHFRIESDRGVALKPGFIRVANPAISAILASDTYSTRTTIECSEDKESGVEQCLGLNNSNYCKDPKDTFRFRSIKDDNSVIMVGNRCMGTYKKYVKQWRADKEDTDYSNDLESPYSTSRKLFRMKYYEDRMAFKMKNQIFEDYQNNDQPVLTLQEQSDGAGAYKLKITPVVSVDIHEQYILETRCETRH